MISRLNEWVFVILTLSIIVVGCAKIELISEVNCDFDRKSGFNLDVKLKNSNGQLAADANVVVPETVSGESFKMQMSVSKLMGANYVDIININTLFCDVIDRGIKNLWIKLANAANPKLANTCPIAAGTYALNNFVVDPKDIPFAAFKGQYKMFIKGFKDETVIYCRTLEILIN